MVRVRIVGGKLTADQFLACDELARTVGNGTLRITTRQEFQLHGVLKNNLTATIRRSTSRCSRPWRPAATSSATCSAARPRPRRTPRPASGRRPPLGRARRAPVVELLGHLARRREDRDPAAARAAQVPTAGDDPVEPLYGKTYLPRKFKTAFALPEDNCTDIHANDLGFLAIVEEAGSSATTCWSAAGWARPRAPRRRFRSWPYRSATSIGPTLEIGEAVLKVFRDFGNRSDRKRARLKYIIHDWGLPAFRAKIEEYLGHPLADPKPVAVTDVDDHLGWHEQGDGKLFLGIPVENGRIKDEGTFRLSSGLRAFFERYQTRPG